MRQNPYNRDFNSHSHQSDLPFKRPRFQNHSTSPMHGYNLQGGHQNNISRSSSPIPDRGNYNPRQNQSSYNSDLNFNNRPYQRSLSPMRGLSNSTQNGGNKPQYYQENRGPQKRIRRRLYEQILCEYPFLDSPRGEIGKGRFDSFMNPNSSKKEVDDFLDNITSS